MAVPERGEVDYVTPADKHLILKFSNAGRRVVEDMLDMESNAIIQNAYKAGPGDRIKTALFFGATRKHHARDFPSVPAVDNFMDDFADAREDAEEAEEGAALDMELELICSLLAAYQRIDKKTLLKMFKGETDAEDTSGAEAPKEETETKKVKTEKA